MQCQDCNEHTATIHLTEISSGNRQERHLCQDCAQKQGLAVKNQIPLNELLTTLLAAQGDADEQTISADPLETDKECPLCGMTLQRFRKESLLGCANDYEVFEETLKHIIEKSQGGNTSHCGKVPSHVPTDTQDQIKLMALRQELEAAVKAEDYEKAAQLRDQIEQPK